MDSDKLNSAQEQKTEAAQNIASCPCKRHKCPRHGSCEACREHHRLNKKNPPACERTSRRQRGA